MAKKSFTLNLNDIDLSGINMPRNMYFVNASFQGANLQRAHLRDTNFQNAKFDYANLCGANLSITENLTQEQIETAFGDGATKLPKGLHKPSHWNLEELGKERSEKEWKKWIEYREQQQAAG